MSYLENLKTWFEEKFKLHFDKKSDKNIFKQGEIYYVNFGINIGSEFNFTRPALIFELTKYSFWRKNVIAIPITSLKESKKYNQFDIKLTKNEKNGLKEDSVIKLFHIRDISKNRVKTRIGELDSTELGIVQKTFQKIYIKKPD